MPVSWVIPCRSKSRTINSAPVIVSIFDSSKTKTPPGSPEGFAGLLTVTGYTPALRPIGWLTTTTTTRRTEAYDITCFLKRKSYK
ncbi:hypothetical protein Hthe01_00750 [Hydrogenophilus thermoluteolus]|nr:hypothetical protein Hthe01_00750 [Hydrogenophilus thermoluteolus]